jgi:hypothetical protein
MTRRMTDEKFCEYIYGDRFRKYAGSFKEPMAGDEAAETFRRRVADLEKAPNRRTAS